MSTFNNTLQAYASRLRAQRRAAERQAQQAARSKTPAEREQDRARIQQERDQRQALDQVPLTKDFVVRTMLGGVIRGLKMHDLELASGERAQVTRDMTRLAETYYYEGHVASRIYTRIDARHYSEAAFVALTNMLLHLRMVNPELVTEAQQMNNRLVIVFKTNDYSSVSINPVGTDLERIKALDRKTSARIDPNGGCQIFREVA